MKVKAILCLLYTSICAVLSVTSGFAVGLVLCMLGFAGDLFFIMRSQKAYRRLFKERLVRSELEKQFGDLRYLPEAGIPASSIEQTGMMRIDVYKRQPCRRRLRP